MATRKHTELPTAWSFINWSARKREVYSLGWAGFHLQGGGGPIQHSGYSPSPPKKGSIDGPPKMLQLTNNNISIYSFVYGDIICDERHVKCFVRRGRIETFYDGHDF